jgi:hypothetical protein
MTAKTNENQGRLCLDPQFFLELIRQPITSDFSTISDALDDSS